jgi:hypothetical protein
MPRRPESSSAYAAVEGNAESINLVPSDTKSHWEKTAAEIALLEAATCAEQKIKAQTADLAALEARAFAAEQKLADVQKRLADLLGHAEQPPALPGSIAPVTS